MKGPYPELQETVSSVAKVIEREEQSFFQTIDAGLNRIDRVFDEMKKSNKTLVPGRDGFDMYQTHGFPPELFETIAAEHNFAFDWAASRRRWTSTP